MPLGQRGSGARSLAMNYRYRTRPYPHQVRALRKLLRNRGGGLQVPMRWGKSKVGVDFACAMRDLEGYTRVIVVTVTSGLGVWEDEIGLHSPYSYRVFDHNGELQAEDLGRGPNPLDFVVVNYQNVYTRHGVDGRSWVAMPHKGLDKFNAQIVIVDESHHIGNPTALQTKQIRRLGRTAKARVIMTGSMFHRKPIYVFGQALFYDDGASLGSAWGHYKRRISVMGGYGGYEVLKYRNFKWVRRQLRPWCFMAKYVPPRPPVINRLHFHLTGKGLAQYSEMAKESVIKVDGETIISEIVLSRHLRLSQIAGGFVKKPSGGYAQVGDDKITLCKDRLNEYMEQGIEKAVVGCRFIPELRAVALAAKEVGFKVVLFHGGVPKGRERTRRIKFFQTTDKPCLFISQISAGKESINLSAASVMMFYSMSESYVEHDQFSKRIELFQDKRTLQYDFLIARGTRDEVTFEALKRKQSVAEFMVTNPLLAQQLAVAEKYSSA